MSADMHACRGSIIALLARCVLTGAKGPSFVLMKMTATAPAARARFALATNGTCSEHAATALDGPRRADVKKLPHTYIHTCMQHRTRCRGHPCWIGTHQTTPNQCNLALECWGIPQRCVGHAANTSRHVQVSSAHRRYRVQ
jgi:hypothetical protein